MYWTTSQKQIRRQILGPARLILCHRLGEKKNLLLQMVFKVYDDVYRNSRPVTGIAASSYDDAASNSRRYLQDFLSRSGRPKPAKL